MTTNNTPSTAAAEPRKSEGHVAFLGEFEYFTESDGELYRANISWPVQVGGRRWGRWECPAWMIESWLARAREAFSA